LQGCNAIVAEIATQVARSEASEFAAVSFGWMAALGATLDCGQADERSNR